MNFVKTERVQLCDELVRVGPDAPTLCDGWTAHDLAVHLWLRETDPLAAPGIMIKPLAGVTERRMADAKARYSFGEIVGKLRGGPVPFSVFSLPGADEAANTIEYFVHHEDIRRAQAEPGAPRALAREHQDWFWRRLRLLARPLFRRSPVGVMLERADATDARIHAAPGSRILTVIGTPAEILLYAYGRREAAQVELVGRPDVISELAAADLAV